MNKIEPPSGFFGNRNSNMSVPNENIISSSQSSQPIESNEVRNQQQNTQVKETKKSTKFSFGKLGANSKVKKTSISFESEENKSVKPIEVLEETENNESTPFKNENDPNSKEDPGYEKIKRVKSNYVYDMSRKPKFDEKTKKAINWGDMLRKNEEKKKLEQKLTQVEIDNLNAEEGTADLFKDFIKENEKLNEEERKKREEERRLKEQAIIVKKINDALTVLSNNVSGKKGNTYVKGTISIDNFIANLVILFDYMNPEERGRILNICIFGCLISRAKLNGTGGKPALAKFPALINAFKGYTTGGSSNANGKVYLQVREILVSSKLSSFRTDATAAEQVTRVTELINKVVLAKKEIYFPTETFSDPIPVMIGDSKVPDVKSVGLVGLPTLDNLNNFFTQTVSKPKTNGTGKPGPSKKRDDDYHDDNVDIEESLSKSLHQRGNEW